MVVARVAVEVRRPSDLRLARELWSSAFPSAMSGAGIFQVEKSRKEDVESARCLLLMAWAPRDYYGISLPTSTCARGALEFSGVWRLKIHVSRSRSGVRAEQTAESATRLAENKMGQRSSP